jgi:heptosyltransferase-2
VRKGKVVKRFLVINPFGIGDVLFTTPVIRAIKTKYPDAFIGYWCNARVEDVLKCNPYVDKIFALSRGDIKKIFQGSVLKGIRSTLDLFLKIRKEKFETCFDYSLDHRYGLAAKLAGIKTRIGFDYKGRGRFLTLKAPLSGYQNRHVIDYYLDLLKFSGIAPAGGKMDLVVADGASIKARHIFARSGISTDKPVVGICPAGGASWGKDARLKHWPELKFAQLIDLLAGKHSVEFVVLGDELDRPQAEALVLAAKSKTTDLTGKLTLEELIAVISSLDVLITNDGGPLHIAVARGTKTVSIFGPTDSRVYGPYPPDSKRHIVLKGNQDCSPCYSKFRYPPCQKNICLEEIDVAEAAKAVSSLLPSK